MSEEAKLWFWGGTALVPSAPGGVIEDSAIGVSDSKIVFVGSRAQAKVSPQARKLDATGCLVMPGLVNGHTHTGMSLLRGFADDMPLESWLRERVFPIERQFASEEFVYWGTLLASAEMIRAGVTTFNDMYYFEDQAARASSEAGLRMVAGQTLVEESDVDGTGKNLEANFDRFRQSVSDFPLVTPAIAPHAIYSISERVWKTLIQYAKRNSLRLHVHLSEVEGEVEDSLKKFGKTPTEVFHEWGLWECPVTVAHAVCLSPRDIELLGRGSVGVSHNPQSNLKLGTKVAPVVELRRAGVPVALGTDSTASNNNLDVFEEADFAAKLQAMRLGAGALRVEEVFAMLTSEGAKAVGTADQVGTVEVGKQADLIALEVSAPHAVPLYNPYSHVVYSAGGRDVRHTVVAGQVLMESRNLLTLDEQEILREAVSWARRIKG